MHQGKTYFPPFICLIVWLALFEFFFFYFYLPLRDWLNQFSHVLDFYSAVPQSDLTWVVCWYYAAALSLYSFPGASLLLPAMCVSVSDPPDKLFYALYSQKRLSSLCLHQESSSRLWTQRGQATQTTRHIVTPIDQMLSSFFPLCLPCPSCLALTVEMLFHPLLLVGVCFIIMGCLPVPLHNKGPCVHSCVFGMNQRSWWMGCQG